MEQHKPAVSSMYARPFLRHKAIVIFATAATATAAAFKYQSASLNRNDIEQGTRKAPPFGYVSVDRSGGGI